MRKQFTNFLLIFIIAIFITVIFKPAVVSGKNSFESVLQQGKYYYQQTLFTQSYSWLGKAYALALENDNLIQQVQVLNLMAMTEKSLGNYQQANTSIEQSITILTSQLEESNQSIFLLSQALNIQGNIKYHQGQTVAALHSWQQAEIQATKIEDFQGIQGSLINQVTAYLTLGQYQKATTILNRLELEITQQPDSELKVYSLLSLGNALQKQGNVQQAELVLRQALDITENSLIWFSLANTLNNLDKVDEALIYYDKVIENSNDNSLKIKAELNKLNIFIPREEWGEVNRLIGIIKPQIMGLTASRSNIYSRINWVQSLLKISEQTGKDYSLDIVEVLKTALNQAERLEDRRSQSYIYGNLGTVYFRQGRITEAEILTEKALVLAEVINAKDILVSWKAQIGNIYKQQGRKEEAIKAYQSAVKDLEVLNQDLYSNNREIQLSFRESVEPIYRELIDLLLSENQPSTENIQQAIAVFEQLHIAELKNFFKDGCLVSKTAIEVEDEQSAIIYPIILPSRLVVITDLPGEEYKYSSVNIPQSELEPQVIKVRNSFHPFTPNRKRQELTQQVYNWLIAPIATDLAKYEVKTLIFALDGVMRNLPMNSLYDGEKYLLEQYAIAVIPVRVELFNPQPWQEEKLEVLIGGLSESQQGFSPLPGVELEVKEIAAQSKTEILLNANFTQENLAQSINQASFPVVHLATHGQFSSQQEDTFLLAWDDTINIQELENILKNRNINQNIELLVLSACQTASGDKRAALGLAGLAVRSGAGSVVASLWSVNDESTALLMINFYEQLRKYGINKSEALRQAQLSMLSSSKYNHPYYWSGFVMVGNWL